MTVTTPVDLYGVDAELEHGWSPSTPLDDSIGRRATLALAESTATPVEAMGGRVLRTSEFVASDLGRPAGYWNSATIVRPLNTAGWDHALDEIDRFFAEPTRPRSVELLFPFPTPDLRPRGWELGGHPPAMWLPAGPPRSPAHARVEVRAVRDERALREWAVSAASWFPIPDAGTGLATRALLDDPDVALFVGRVDGRPVSISSSVLAHGANAVPLVATDPHARGRGYGSAATWTAARASAGLPTVLLASDDGQPVYRRMGFVPLSRWTLWTRPAGA